MKRPSNPTVCNWWWALSQSWMLLLMGMHDRDYDVTFPRPCSDAQIWKLGVMGGLISKSKGKSQK